MKNPLQFFDPSTGEIMRNSLGYSQIISTLTAVGRRVSEQKFYEISPADYVPVVMGNGAYKKQIINWRTFVKGEGFATGIIGNASNNARLASTDAAFDMVSQNVIAWAKSISWNLFELQEALQAGTLFGLVEAKELARKKEWDLGIQSVAFKGIGAETGLLNNASAVTNTTAITKKINTMTAAEFNTFVGTIYEVYRANTSRTAKPTAFYMPESEWNGLINFPDSTFPLKTKLQLLEEAFKTITMNSAFKLLPCAYCDKANSPDGTNNFYVMLNYDESSVKMDIPLQYQSLAAGTVNGFTFENVAYGQFTGVIAQRPKELMYFTNTAS